MLGWSMSAETTTVVSPARQPTDARAEHDAPPMEAGRHVGRYVVVGTVGRGGMGTVYEAFDPELERRVAIKILRRSAMRRLGESSTKRMLREAQSLARLSHPNVVPVYDVGVDHGRIWVAMEYVDGVNLSEWLGERRQWREIVEVFVAAGQGLLAVHDAGLVHRDFKPGNVLVGRDGRVRVTDFGLARARGDTQAERPSFHDVETPAAGSEPTNALELSITRSGTTVGTPAYMAPEQHALGAASAQSDQFAFCVALYEALWGQRPFEGRTIHELERMKASGTVRAPTRDDSVPHRLWPVVRRGLSPRANHRWPSMQALLAELERVDRVSRTYIAVLVAGCLGAGAWWMARDPPPSACEMASDRLAEVWNADRRTTLRDALERGDETYGPRTALVVEQAIDDHARRWLASYEGTCRAGEAKPSAARVVSARRACLDDRLQRLDASITVLGSGDAAVLEKAVQSVADLGLDDDCSVTGSSLTAYAPPHGEEAELQELRKQIHRVSALSRAGKTRVAVQEAEEALERARELGHPPALVEALTETGQARGSVGDTAEAEAALQEAVFLGESIGYDELAARAAVELTSLLASTRSRLDEAHWWSRRAEAAVRRLGEPRMLRGRLHDALGQLALEEGDLATSYEHFSAALSLARSTEQAQPHRVARALDRLGAAAVALGRVSEARSLNEEAYALIVDSVGEDHPMVGWIVLEEARLAERVGDFPTALERHTRARSIFETTLGSDSKEALYATDQAAAVLAALGRHHEALELHRAAVAGLEAKLGPDHPNLAIAHHHVGDCLARLERHEESLVAFTRAHAINERAFGSEHFTTAFSHNMLGLALNRLDRGDEARWHMNRSLEIKHEVFGPEHPEVAYAFANLAMFDHEAGQLQDAREGFARAVALLDTPDDTDPLGLARMLVALAEIELALANGEAAVESARHALRLFARIGTHEADPLRAVEVITRHTLELSP
mgnify:CR=1 FL=1